MKIKKNNLYLIIYLISLVSFIFLKCQDISSQQAAAISVILIPLLGKLYKCSGVFRWDVYLILGLVSLEVLLSYHRYGQSFNVILYYAMEFISLIAYLYLTNARNITLNRYIHIIICFFKIILITFILIALVFNVTRIEVLDHFAYTRLRNGTVSLYYGAPAVTIGFFVFFGYLLYGLNNHKKMKTFDVVLLALSAFYYVFVCQSRMILFATLVSFTCMYIFGYKNASKKVIIVLFALIMVIGLFQLPSIQGYVSQNFLSILNGTDGAAMPRFGAIEHYLEVTKNNELLGFGYFSINAESNGLFNLQYLLRGQWGTYFTDDVGIIGLYFTYGILGVILYTKLAIKMIRIGIKERYINPFKLGIAVFFIVSLISISFFDLQRQSYLPMVLLCMDLNIKDEEKMVVA